jgi:hypothetical protein
MAFCTPAIDVYAPNTIRQLALVIYIRESLQLNELF